MTSHESLTRWIEIGRLKGKPWLLGTRRSVRTRGMYGRQETRCETSASTRLPLIKLYSFTEPQFPYLFNGDNYVVCFTRLSLGWDEAINAKCLMPNQYLHGCVLVSSKECLRCLVRKGAWKQIPWTMKRKESGVGRRTKRIVLLGIFGLIVEVAELDAGLPVQCQTHVLLCQTHFLIIGLNKRPLFPHRLSLAHQTSIWPYFVSVNSYFKTPCTWGEISGLCRGLNWNIPSRWFRRRKSFCTFLKKLAVFVGNTAEWPKLWPGLITLFESCLESLSTILGLTRFLVRYNCPLVRGQHSLAVFLANPNYDHRQGAQGYLFTTPTSRSFLRSELINCYHWLSFHPSIHSPIHSPTKPFI